MIHFTLPENPLSEIEARRECVQNWISVKNPKCQNPSKISAAEFRIRSAFIRTCFKVVNALSGTTFLGDFSTTLPYLLSDTDRRDLISSSLFKDCFQPPQTDFILGPFFDVHVCRKGFFYWGLDGFFFMFT